MCLYQLLLSQKFSIIPNKLQVENDCAEQSGQKKLTLRNLDMFLWTSGFHNPLDHTHFNMFVDEWSTNQSPH